jgi:hypothetical protein
MYCSFFVTQEEEKSEACEICKLSFLVIIIIPLPERNYNITKLIIRKTETTEKSIM